LILDGSLQVDGMPLDLIPLPFAAKGRVLIQLEGAQEEGRLMAIGDAVRVEPRGEARLIENVPFSVFPSLD
jgi:hypothetical protein